MLLLDLPTKPYWLDLPRRVRVASRPVTTAVTAAARRGSAFAFLVKSRARLAVTAWDVVGEAAGKPLPLLRRSTAFPAASLPCVWNTRLAISRPIVETSLADGPLLTVRNSREPGTPMPLRGRPPHQVENGASGPAPDCRMRRTAHSQTDSDAL
jgi:hypothetical protein